MRTRIWLLAVAVLVIAAAFGGCEDDAAGPDPLTGRAGIKVGLDFVLLNLPGGDAEISEPPVAELDTATYPTDLFQRGAPSRDPVFVQDGDLDIDKTTDWSAPRFWFDDPRLPRLREHEYYDTYGDNIDMIEFQRPDRSSRIDRWDYRSDIDYVGDLDFWYAIGLARYATVVRGLVDHLEILVYNGEVRQPDSLVLLGGSPGGYPDHQADFWVNSDPPDDYCPPVPADANPFIMGHFKTGPTVDPKDAGADYDGETDADYCFLGSGLWQSGYDNPLHPDSVPFAPNNLESFDLPQYNYLVVWAYDRATGTVLYDKPHMRAQVGVDIDLNGDPIPHAFAPLPTAPGKELSMFASYDEFLADPRVTRGVVEVTLAAENLKPLTQGSAYQVWLVDEVENEAVRVSPTYTLQRPDTVGFDELDQPIIEWVNVGDPLTLDSFDGATGRRHVIVLRNADLGGLRLARFTLVVITIGGAEDASPMSSPAPAWYRYQDQNDTREDPDDNEEFMSGTIATGFIPERAAEGIGWQPRRRHHRDSCRDVEPSPGAARRQGFFSYVFSLVPGRQR